MNHNPIDFTKQTFIIIGICYATFFALIAVLGDGLSALKEVSIKLSFILIFVLSIIYFILKYLIKNKVFTYEGNTILYYPPLNYSYYTLIISIFIIGVINYSTRTINNSSLITNKQIPITFDQCGYAKNWILPTDDYIQRVMKQRLNRYTLEDFETVYGNTRFYFLVESGLSGEGDLLYTSGLIDLPDSFFCHKFGNWLSVRNSAELWLLFYKLDKLEWNGSKYIATVTPQKTGAQFVEFARYDEDDKPRIEIRLANNQFVDELIAY
jgi:hypothetical protein